MQLEGDRMSIIVREMALAEVDLVIEYFHGSTPEYLDLLGVDPTRLPSPDVWRERFQTDLLLPLDERARYFLIWLQNGRPIGFSSCDKIVFGQRANMHLHITEADLRQRGVGSGCVRLSVDTYFEKLKLKSLFCEPNAFNVGPNRTLQNAGFKYLKTHKTVPGMLNYHQAVTQWVIER